MTAGAACEECACIHNIQLREPVMRLHILPPVAFVLCIAAMAALHAAVPIVGLLPQPFNWAGTAFITGGVGIAAWHARLFRRIGTNIHTFGEPGILVREGLFQVSRNPMYLGFAMALLGVAMLLGSATPFGVALAFVLLADRWYIEVEEQAMLKKFGVEYERYRQQVPRWI